MVLKSKNTTLKTEADDSSKMDWGGWIKSPKINIILSFWKGLMQRPFN